MENNSEIGFKDNTGTYYPNMESVHKYMPNGRSIEPAKDPLARRRAAREFGYTVHPANDSSQYWAYCIEGDYSHEYPSEKDAWDAAIAAFETSKKIVVERR